MSASVPVSKSAWESLRNIGFIHLHGSLGALPEQADANAELGTSIEFGAPDGDGVYTLGIALSVIENLVRIVHDAHPTELFNMVQSYFAIADQILFLGFGFGRTNVERLGTNRIPTPNPVYCTAFDMTDSEVNTLIAPAFPGRSLIPGSGYVEAVPIRRFFRERMHVLS
jgi:hypothetical protein